MFAMLTNRARVLVVIQTTCNSVQRAVSPHRTADDLSAVIALYGKFSALARAGAMRNPDPLFKGMALQSGDTAALVAFLKSLNEDYN